MLVDRLVAIFADLVENEKGYEKVGNGTVLGMMFIKNFLLKPFS